MGIDSRVRSGCAPAVLVAIVLACASAPGSAAAASASTAPRPLVVISAPREVVSGSRFAVTGNVSGGGASGRVVVQADRGDGWDAVGRGRLRHRRFRVLPSLAGEGGARLRATVRSSGYGSARSATRRVLIRAAAVAPRPASLPPDQTAPAPPAEAPPSPPAVPESPPSSSTYWGAWIGPQFTGTPAPEDMDAVTYFEALSGKPLSLLETFSPWAICSGSPCAPNQPFPRAALEKMRGYGAIPLYSWASERNGEVTEPDYQLADIISGTYDSYIRQWATEAKAWGHPFFLRFDWEMNGTWFPWAESVNGNQPGEYVAAWRHVHDIFTEVGATNATWVWCPYVDPNGNLEDASALYPGDEYVDWTCLDGYNRGTASGGQWRTFAYLFGPDYRQITETIAPSKPMLIGEVASSESGGSKAAWIEEMFAQLPTDFPAVRGLLWFDYYDQGNDWPLETSSSATASFAAGIGEPRYLTNAFASAPDGPVPVP